VGPEILALQPEDANATEHVYIPYLFKANNRLRFIFTARGNTLSKQDEWIGLAESKDGFNWTVIAPKVFEAALPWEANSVENFGLLLHKGTLWMNYESKGPLNSLAERSLGIAYSADSGRSWNRISTQPSISGGVYCAGFFTWRESVYLIASAYNQFRVYRADSPRLLSNDSYRGSFFIQQTGETVVDTPSVVTNSASKIPSGEFVLTYSIYNDGKWNTYLSRWNSTDDFLDQLVNQPLNSIYHN
jgi:hypothetical protein